MDEHEIKVLVDRYMNLKIFDSVTLPLIKYDSIIELECRNERNNILMQASETSFVNIMFTNKFHLTKELL